MNAQHLTAVCTCGAVEFACLGEPLATAVCYCDDCQAAARLIEALPGHSAFRQDDGGTLFVIYRKDRVRCTKGDALLVKRKLRANSATNRWLTKCCNSVMTLDFDDSKHWVDVYGARIQPSPPKPQALICTKFAAQTPANPDRIPSYPGYAPRLLLKLLAARVAMLFSR